MWIPPRNRNLAGSELTYQLKKRKWSNIEPHEIQDQYYLEGKIKKTLEKFGKNKKMATTDDKLSKATNDLISKRTEIRGKIKLSVLEPIELTELNKIIKRKIREDVRNFEVELAEEIIENTWSTRKAKKALANSTKILPRIKSKAGKVTSNREEINEIASNFYRSLYDDAGSLSGDSDHWSRLVLNKTIPAPISK